MFSTVFSLILKRVIEILLLAPSYLGRSILEFSKMTKITKMPFGRLWPTLHCRPPVFSDEFVKDPKQIHRKKLGPEPLIL